MKGTNMDNQIATIDTKNYDLMAEVMGIEGATSPKSVDTLCRMKIWNQAIMGTVDQDGKKRKMEVVPGGTYRLDDRQKFAYADTISFRPYMQRFRFNRWLPYATPDAKGKKGRYLKSVFTGDYKTFTSSDLMDEDGGFNCGRPSGYIKDWEAQPEETRKLITSVKRVRAIFGTVTLNNALNEVGETVDTGSDPIPVVWEIENNKAFKIMGEALQKYSTAGRLFPQHSIVLSTEGSPMTNGNMLYMPVPDVDLRTEIEIQPQDSETLANFQAWIANYNNFIVKSYQKKAPNSVFSKDEEEVIDSFITVDE
tara:strand:+ start:599 stop:1525 length:927 start_codon:yes stop_codon:yes gene_type:complete